MSTCYPTPESLQNFETDIETVAAYVNGDNGVPNVNRDGEDVGNLQTLNAQALALAAGAANLQTYLSKAAMDADTSQPVNTVGQVTNDPEPDNNGYYVWNGTTWLYSGLQPARQSDVVTLQESVVDLQSNVGDLQLEYIGGLRKDLRDPLKSLNVRLVGDSITWGTGASGTSPSTPRNGTITDARNTIDAAVSPTWANLFRRWLIATFADLPIIQDAPGSGYVLVKNVVDIFGAQAVDMTWRRGVTSKEIPPETIVANRTANVGSNTGIYSDFYMNLNDYPAEVEFQTSATELEIIYAKTAVGTSESRTVNVYVDGAVHTTFTGWGATATFNNVQLVTLDGLPHTVIIRNESSSGSIFRMQGMNATRRIGVANDGIIGSNTNSWLNQVTLADSIAPQDTHVLIQLGTNDRITSANWNLYAFFRNLAKIVDDTRALAPGCSITLMVANAVTQNEGAGSAYSFGMRTVDAVVRMVASAKRCGFVSQYALTTQDKIDGVDITPDGLHPGDPIHRKMFENIKDRLQAS